VQPGGSVAPVRVYTPEERAEWASADPDLMTMTVPATERRPRRGRPRRC
jgi:hypothetical protein